MDYLALQAELKDPSYGQLSAEEAAAQLNDPTRVAVPVVRVDPVRGASLVRLEDWRKLAAADHAYLVAAASAGGLDLSIPGVVEDLLLLFPPDSATGQALAAAFSRQTSRSEVLGLGHVWPNDVAMARKGVW